MINLRASQEPMLARKRIVYSVLGVLFVAAIAAAAFIGKSHPWSWIASLLVLVVFFILGPVMSRKEREWMKKHRSSSTSDSASHDHQ